MKNKKLFVGIITLILMLMLFACGSSNKNSYDKNVNTNNKNTKMDKNTDMDGMKMSDTAEVPKGLKAEQNPTFKVGSHAIVHADHMVGMNGMVPKRLLLGLTIPSYTYLIELPHLSLPISHFTTQFQFI